MRKKYRSCAIRSRAAWMRGFAGKLSAEVNSMEPKYPNMYQLLEGDAVARRYFDDLPDYVRDQIRTRADNVNSIDSLRDYAENLLRGDD